MQWRAISRNEDRDARPVRIDFCFDQVANFFLVRLLFPSVEDRAGRGKNEIERREKGGAREKSQVDLDLHACASITIARIGARIVDPPKCFFSESATAFVMTGSKE